MTNRKWEERGKISEIQGDIQVRQECTGMFPSDGLELPILPKPRMDISFKEKKKMATWAGTYVANNLLKC